MKEDTDISDEIRTLTAFKGLTSAYSQIASLRMKAVRDLVLKDRAYMAAINEIFEEVRYSYVRQIKKLAGKNKKKDGKITLLAHNGKNVAVLLSSNTGLYGAITKKTYNKFLYDIKAGFGEAVIVGRQGLSDYLIDEPDRPYTYFDLPDTKVSVRHLTSLLRHVVQYEKIRVYFGKFSSFVDQAPDVLEINSEIDFSQSEKVHKAEYLFEPNLEKIMTFFELEIFSSLFEQSVRESELAKHASRVLAMDKAAQNINKEVDKLQAVRLKSLHRDLNKKQLNSLSGVLLQEGVFGG